MTGGSIPIKFKVRAITRPGEVVVLTGSSRAFGSFQIERGLQLTTSPVDYPLWYTPKPVILKSGETVKYKYAIFSGGVFNRYEHLSSGEYRTFLVPSGVKLYEVDDILQDQTKGHSSPDNSSRGEGAGESSSQQELASPTTSNDHHELSNLSTASPLPLSFAISGESSINDSDHLQKAFTKNRSKLSLTSAEGKKEAKSWKPTTESDISRKRRTSNLGGGGTGGSIGGGKSNYYDDLHSFSSSIDEETYLDSRDGILIVSYFLPVKLTRSLSSVDQSVRWDVIWDEDSVLSPKSFQPMSSSPRISFIGFPITLEPIPVDEQDIVADVLSRLNCVPVFLEQKLHEDHYYGYCKNTLHEIFNGIVDILAVYPTRWWNGNAHKALWIAYNTVNRRFAEKIVEFYNDGDIIWIHGLELCLLPSQVSRRLISSHPKIGFFLDTPFPSSEIFRTLSVREDILRGILGADHVGFHLYEYVRHFLTCCKRILGLACEPAGKGASGMLNVLCQGRYVNITAMHAGVDPVFLNKMLESNEIKEKSKSIRLSVTKTNDLAEASTHILIACVDDSTRLQGGFLQMLAFERFLNQTKDEYRGRIHLIQYTYAVPKGSEGTEKVLSGCAEVAARLSLNYPGSVHYEVRNAPICLADRLSLFAASDILFLTPIREGLSLYPFEFILASANQKGTMILSDFSSHCHSLKGAYRVNPMRIDESVRCIIQSLNLSNEERNARFNADYSFVMSHTVEEWAIHVLNDIKMAHAYNVDQGVEMEYTSLGLGSKFRSVGFRPNFTRLDDDEVLKSYRKSSNRLFLLDYGGTTVRGESDDINGGEESEQEQTQQPILNNNSNKNATAQDPSTSNLFVQKTSVTMPSPALIRALQLLCADPRNTVFIVSGREQEELEIAFGSVPVVSLVSEHGFYYSWGAGTQVSKQRAKLSGSTKPALKRTWDCIGTYFDQSWKEITVNIMSVYTARTHGSYIEHKGSTILWQFRDADGDFGAIQAQELRDHLDGVLKSFPVVVEVGMQYLEVRFSSCDKGKAALHIIDVLETAGCSPDFILALGDDVADERMFNALNDALPRLKSSIPAPLFSSSTVKSQDADLAFYTAVVGKKASAANHFLHSVDDVENLLTILAKSSVKENRSVSLADFRVLDLYSGKPTNPVSIIEEEEVTGNEYYNTWKDSIIEKPSILKMSSGANLQQQQQQNRVVKISRYGTSTPGPGMPDEEARIARKERKETPSVLRESRSMPFLAENSNMKPVAIFTPNSPPSSYSKNGQDNNSTVAPSTGDEVSTQDAESDSSPNNNYTNNNNNMNYSNPREQSVEDGGGGGGIEQQSDDLSEDAIFF